MEKRLLHSLKKLIIHPHNQLYAVQTNAESYLLQKGYLAEDIIKNHLIGTDTIAVVLLQPITNTAKAGTIDVDKQADEDLKDTYEKVRHIQAKATDLGLKSYIEFSGRRGFHLWLFSAEPLPGKTWVPLLKSLCEQAGHKGKELFPSGATVTEEGQGPGSKPIKLPCGIHQGSGRRSGFLSDEVQWDTDGFPVLPEDQAGLMEALEQNPVDKLVQVALACEEKVEKPKTIVTADTATNFSTLAAGQHPSCIQHLITRGAPRDQQYNAVNLTLARYAISRNLTDQEAATLGEQMAKATPDTHPTGKDFQARVDNFKSVLRSARRQPDQYRWSCGYQRESKELLAAGGCPGWTCPFWPYRKSEKQPAWQTGPADTLAERELLGYLLANPQALPEASRVEIPPEGFQTSVPLSDSPGKMVPLTRIIWKTLVVLGGKGHEVRPSLILANLDRGEVEKGVSDLSLQKTADEYLRGLSTETPCTRQTFLHHMGRLRETGLRLLAAKHVQHAGEVLTDRRAALPSVLENLTFHTRELQRRTRSEVLPMADFTLDLSQNLFGEPAGAISTPSQWLNRALNGGWQPGRLYVLGAPPGAGKTTFACYCADFAGGQGFPAVIMSFEMTREQLWIYSLARLGGIDSSLIERKRWQDQLPEDEASILEQLTTTAKSYRSTVAPKVTIIEAGSTVSSADLQGIIAQVRHNAAVPEDGPVLVILDYLQLMSSGDARLDAGGNETLRVSRVVTSLKRLARDAKAAVLAISDITKESYKEATKTGKFDMAALRDSFKIAHAADCVLLLQTDEVDPGGSGNAKNQLDLVAARYKTNPDKLRKIESVRTKYPLDPKVKSAYARLGVIKNRGGMRAEPLFVYEKAYHRFIPIELDLGEPEEKDDDNA